MWRLVADEDALRVAWQTAAPFPHLILDDAVADAALPDLFAALDDEDVAPYEGDLLSFEASAPEPATPELRAVRDAFAQTFAPALARIT
ncbi:MAG TPA: hypothetical protein VL326_22105, partial [Kofleriaceae bacterium]|nr:hypothetical protein [Kofleriaceae bacterium]